MHDIADLEARGVASVVVCSEGFVEAAEVQAVALGTPVARVFVPHPIQDRTDAEVRAYADGAFDAIVRAVTRAG